MTAPSAPGPHEPPKLSSREQRILAGIEGDLTATDPALAHTMTWPAGHPGVVADLARSKRIAGRRVAVDRFIVMMTDLVTDEIDAYGPLNEARAVGLAARTRSDLRRDDITDVFIGVVPLQARSVSDHT